MIYYAFLLRGRLGPPAEDRMQVRAANGAQPDFAEDGLGFEPCRNWHAADRQRLVGPFEDRGLAASRSGSGRIRPLRLSGGCLHTGHCTFRLNQLESKSMEKMVRRTRMMMADA
jgi:hypothetical protein